MTESYYTNRQKNIIQKYLLIAGICALLPIAFQNTVFADTSFPATSTNLSSSPATNSLSPKIASAGDIIHTVWVEGTDIVYSKSTDGGSTFSPAAVLGSKGSTSTPNHNISVSGNNVYVTWTDGAEIFLAVSTDGGTTFPAAANISQTASTASTLPFIASDGSTIHVVWRDGNNIVYRKSTDGGATFTPATSSAPTTIGTMSIISPNPQVAISDNNVYITWQSSTSILFRRSSDAGANFIPDLASSPTTLGSAGTLGVVSSPQMLASDNSLYVIWKSNSNIVFRKSTDSGANFIPNIASSPTTIGSTATNAAVSNHQIRAFSDSLYIVWTDQSEILFRSSSDKGTTFSPDLANAPTNISQSSDISFLPDITAYENDVFVGWRERAATSDDTDVGFLASTKSPPSGLLAELLFENTLADLQGSDNGGTVTGTTSFVNGPASAGMAFDFDGASQIQLANEATFDFERTNSFSASFWVKTTSASDQYIVGKSDSIGSTGWSISLTSGRVQVSLSNTATTNEARVLVGAADAINDGIWHHVTVTYDGSSNTSGIKVFIDGTQKTTTDQANNLSSSILNDLAVTVGGSNSGANKLTGKIDGLRIYNKALTTSEVSYLAGKSQTPTFDAVKDLSSNLLHSDEPKLASAKASVYVVWSEKSTAGSTDGEIRFKKGTVTNISVQFVETPSEYRLSETATIRVVDSSKSGSVTATITSTSSPGGFSATLDETGSGTGVFEKQISFITSGTSGGSSLLVQPGNTIIATYETVSASGSIFSRTVIFPFDLYNRGDITAVIVTDQNSNVNPATAESIVVTVTSLQASGSVDLTLTETDVNTGIFGSTAAVKLIFTTGDDRYSTSDRIKISVEHAASNIDENIRETATVTITSTSSPGGISLVLTETGPNTAIFEGTLELTTGDSVAGTKIHVVGGDILNVVSPPPSFTSHALITPNPSAAVGILPVTITSTTPETITATFGGSSDVATIDFIAGEPGGGGGGLVRPGLVLDAVAAIAILGGGGGGNSPPVIGTSSIITLGDPKEGLGGIIDDDQNKKSSGTKTATVGESVVLRFDIFEPGGIGDIGHVTLYLNEGDLDKNLENNNFIRFEKYKDNSIKDKNGIFSDAQFEILEKDVSNFVLKFEIVFAKPIDSSDLMLDVWDLDRRSSKQLFEDAISVEPKQASEIVSTESNSETPADTNLVDNPAEAPPAVDDNNEIPSWIKVSARWWADDQISNDDFILGIEYLAKKEILEIPSTETEGERVKEIPEWIKNTAEWWSDDKISDIEFVAAIQYLIKMGVMKV